MNGALNIVVMGVSGCGKSSVGEALAQRLSGQFIDGDDFHPAENKARMSKGIALTDTDRMPWLKRINEYMRASHPDDTLTVIACSSLRRLYRDVLTDSTSVLFVHLVGDFDLIKKRSESRQGHFMRVDLLQSQFDTLEIPTADENAVTVSIDPDFSAVVDDALTQVIQHDLYAKAN